MAANVRSVLLACFEGVTEDITIVVEHLTTWIVREIYSYSGNVSATLDISEFLTGALLHRTQNNETSIFPSPNLELRHLVLAGSPDGDDPGIVIKPGGDPWDVTISGYILNGVYAPP